MMSLAMVRRIVAVREEVFNLHKCFLSIDTDESKSRMPEHEAAQLLLSLSNHAASTSSQVSAMNHLQLSTAAANWAEQAENQADAITRSRVILSTLKAGEFDLLNHEKYYSDPNLNRPKEIPAIAQASAVSDDVDDAVPMDLTKKPTKSEPRVRVSDVLSKFSEPAVLLNQLVSNIDKMPSSSSVGLNINFTDNVQYNDELLPQEYVTERALRDVRMKQSQHSTKSSDYNQAIIAMASSKDHLINISEDMPFFIRQPVTSTTTSGKNGMMDTLADLAAKSDKLEVKNRSEEQPLKKINANAINVASEYLKLTQQKIQRTLDESNDGLSDQESQETAAIHLTPQTIVVGEDGFRKKGQTSTNISGNEQLICSQNDTGRPVCGVCSKSFQKTSQLKLHMNIHYMERKYRCEVCSVSFRTQGHLQKHDRSVGHHTRINMTSTFGVPTESNPRPFKCKDCNCAFRIHGHLAKHLRSKLHIQKLENLLKLPFGTFAEIERSGLNLTEIDTSDCENSLMSLRELAKKLNEKDPSKLGPLPPLSADDSLDYDENGMNENYDSDSSDLGINSNYNDEDSLKRKSNDSDEVDVAKKMKFANEIEHHVPSSSSPVTIKADD